MYRRSVFPENMSWLKLKENESALGPVNRAKTPDF